MAIRKVCSRCGKIVPTGRACPCQVAANRERHRSYNSYQRDKKSGDFYNSSAWRSLSKRVLKIDGCDVWLYITKGLFVPADTVHHVVPLRDDWSNRLSIDNLISLTHGTHSEIEWMYKQDKDKAIALVSDALRRYRDEIGYQPIEI